MGRTHKMGNSRGVAPVMPSYFTRLPPVCQEPIPEWPLLNEPDDTEKEYWEQLWRSPQATLWHRTRCYIIVARYVELLTKSTDTGLGTGELGEIRQMEDRLAMTPKSMYALYVVVDEEAEDMEYPTKLGENQKKRVQERNRVFKG